MAHAARALGLGVMLGCMVESGLGISAGCQVASLCDHVDLDGNLLLAEDPCPGVELVDGIQVPPDPGPRRRAGDRARVKRYLVLAEGKSGDPHYGKTLRGVVDYGLDPVVAILDTQRAGETHKGIPIVGSVAGGAAATRPTTALVGVATQGGRFPPEWRVLLRDSISRRASTSRTGCTSSSPSTRSSRAWRRRSASSCATCAGRPPGLERPHRREPRGRRATSCSPSAPTARSGR